MWQDKPTSKNDSIVRTTDTPSGWLNVKAETRRNYLIRCAHSWYTIFFVYYHTIRGVYYIRKFDIASVTSFCVYYICSQNLAMVLCFLCPLAVVRRVTVAVSTVNFYWLRVLMLLSVSRWIITKSYLTMQTWTRNTNIFEIGMSLLLIFMQYDFGSLN